MYCDWLTHTADTIGSQLVPQVTDTLVAAVSVVTSVLTKWTARSGIHRRNGTLVYVCKTQQRAKSNWGCG